MLTWRHQTRTVSLWHFKLSEPFVPLQWITIVLWQIPLGQWIVLLTSDCVRQLLYQIRGVQGRSRRCGMRRATPLQRIWNGSSIRWRNDRSDKGGAVPVKELNGFACMKSDVTWFWGPAAAWTREERSDAVIWGLINGAGSPVCRCTYK